MAKRIPLLLTLLISLVLMPGCPLGAGALMGQWAYVNDGKTYGLNLMANGQASSFAMPPDNIALPGTLTWERNGDQFIMNQDYGSGRVIFSGIINSNTSMDGVWMEWIGTFKGDCQSWVANKI